MAGNANQKLKTLYVMKFFYEKTDSEHGATLSELAEYLEANEIKSERKSLYSDIELLRQFGMDIEPRRGKTTDYRLFSREFELSELKLLVDAVGASKFITEKKSRTLIKKLEALASVNEARSLNRSVFVDNRIKTMNESIYYNIDAIHLAITDNRKLAFRYFRYSPSKERVFGHDGNEYVVSPLALVYNNENYYLYAYSGETGEIRTYRVDRVTDAHELLEPREKNSVIAAFNPATRAKTSFDMLSGELRRVSLLIDNSLSTVIIDRFGKDTRFFKETDNLFRINVDVTVSENFLGWVFGFGDKIMILSPDDVRARFATMLKAATSAYD